MKIVENKKYLLIELFINSLLRFELTWMEQVVVLYLKTNIMITGFAVKESK